MKLTDQQVDVAKALWYAQRPACPICAAADWKLLNEVHEIPQVSGEDGFRVCLFLCGACTHIEFLSYIAIEVAAERDAGE